MNKIYKSNFVNKVQNSIWLMVIENIKLQKMIRMLNLFCNTYFIEASKFHCMFTLSYNKNKLIDVS